MPKAKVTIITPTYHRDIEIVKRCVACVRGQTYPDWYHIICSDGEWEQEVRDLVYSEGDPRRGYCKTDKRHNDFGAGVRREVIEKWTESEYVTFWDDDNIFLPNYLQKMVYALETTHGVDFAVCGVMHFGPFAYKNFRRPMILPNNKVEVGSIDTSQVVAKTSAMKAIGGWIGSAYNADGVTYEALGKRFNYVSVDDCLAVHM